MTKISPGIAFLDIGYSSNWELEGRSPLLAMGHYTAFLVTEGKLRAPITHSINFIYRLAIFISCMLLISVANFLIYKLIRGQRKV